MDAIETQRIRIKYRAVLNSVIAFEMQEAPEVLEEEIKCARSLTQDLERIAQLLQSAPDIPRNCVAKMLRWLASNGSETQKAEAKAILALETQHRHREV